MLDHSSGLMSAKASWATCFTSAAAVGHVLQCLLQRWGIQLIGSNWGCGGVSWKHKLLFGGFSIMQDRSVVSDHVAA